MKVVVVFRPPIVSKFMKEHGLDAFVSPESIFKPKTKGNELALIPVEAQKSFHYYHRLS